MTFPLQPAAGGYSGSSEWKFIDSATGSWPAGVQDKDIALECAPATGVLTVSPTSGFSTIVASGLGVYPGQVGWKLCNGSETGALGDATNKVFIFRHQNPGTPSVQEVGAEVGGIYADFNVVRDYSAEPDDTVFPIMCAVGYYYNNIPTLSNPIINGNSRTADGATGFINYSLVQICPIGFNESDYIYYPPQSLTMFWDGGNSQGGYNYQAINLRNS